MVYVFVCLVMSLVCFYCFPPLLCSPIALIILFSVSDIPCSEIDVYIHAPCNKFIMFFAFSHDVWVIGFLLIDTNTTRAPPQKTDCHLKLKKTRPTIHTTPHHSTTPTGRRKGWRRPWRKWSIISEKYREVSRGVYTGSKFWVDVSLYSVPSWCRFLD